MTGQVGQDPAGCEDPRDEAGSGEFGNAGVGAASALEQMKSQHERRHRRLHGSKAVRPERDDDARHEARRDLWHQFTPPLAPLTQPLAPL